MPSQLTNFIGRDVELAELRRLLRERRLVTLTGAGGSGKTRLATEAAALLGPDFPDGIWLVELAPLSRAELLGETVARVLGVPESTGVEGAASLVELLAGFLGTRRTLLILDNCEHLLEECARICDTLLSGCANLRVLATSREPLGIAGESLFRVPLLSVPSLDPVPDPGTLHGFESVSLFVDRARLADARFDLTNGNAAAVAHVCVRLDGIPLAIELAAATLRALPLSELATRLDQRFRLLTSGDRAALPRHRTLQALIDWSHTLLDSRQQTVFRRLAIFPADWTVGAAGPVCAGEGTAQDGNGSVSSDEVQEILMQLVDKSLVQLEHTTGRYRMLETIRLYALDKLRAAGEEETAGRKLFAWCLDFAERGMGETGGTGQHEWFLRLESEQSNVRAALAWAIRRGRAEEAARLAFALWKFWVARAYHREARRWLEQILAAGSSSTLPAPLRARLLGNLGTLSHTVNDFEKASLYHNEALRIWREQGDTRGIAEALHDLGWQQFEAMDLEGARRYAEESLALARGAGDPAAVAATLNLFALASVEAGRLEGLVPALEESLSIWRDLGALPEVANVLVTLARVEQRLGNPERAGAIMMEGLRLLVDLDDYASLIGCLVLMLYFAFDEGKPARGVVQPGLPTAELPRQWEVAAWGHAGGPGSRGNGGLAGEGYREERWPVG